MNRLTIVYTDGYQEHYNVISPDNDINYLTGLKRYKEIVEDDMLKLVLEGSQIVLIPMTNIRKIISQTTNLKDLKVKDYPGFINAKLITD